MFQSSSIIITSYSEIKNRAATLLILAVFIVILVGCRKKRSETATLFFKKTHHEIYQDYTPEGFSAVLKRVLIAERSNLEHAYLIADHYRKNHYKPEFTINHLLNNDLLTIIDHYQKADEHGLNVSLFQTEKLRSMVYKFNNNDIKTINEAYQTLAQIEITAANSLINYSNALQYGVINPKNIYRRYFVTTKRPDSMFMCHNFHIKNIKAYLDSIQPKAPLYIKLQKALKDNFVADGRSAEETKRILIVNLERLRWKNKPYENKYVIVNIPAFTLQVVEKDKSVLTMKVCVGQGRNRDNTNTLAAYNDTTKNDKPFECETPLLNSAIYSAEVNPIWNIPKSIAGKEILMEAAKDSLYLINKGIVVYKNDKPVDHPDAIDWTKVTRRNSPYTFKQMPSADNSLGKIKFLFYNKSSVYLHDTPAKYAFYKRMRAVSHGCVRLGNPQELALALFGPGNRYNEIAKKMLANNPNPTSIWLPKKVPIYITYLTSWSDEVGNLQFRNDVYGLDIVLYDHLQRISK